VFVWTWFGGHGGLCISFFLDGSRRFGRTSYRDQYACSLCYSSGCEFRFPFVCLVTAITQPFNYTNSLVHVHQKKSLNMAGPITRIVLTRYGYGTTWSDCEKHFDVTRVYQVAYCSMLVIDREGCQIRSNCRDTRHCLEMSRPSRKQGMPSVSCRIDERKVGNKCTVAATVFGRLAVGCHVVQAVRAKQ
jgi:hypothetical protein